MALIEGSDGGQTQSGTGAADLIYGFDPKGSQATPANITATRIAAGLAAPLYVTGAPDDPNRLFVVEKTGRIKVIDISAADAGVTAVVATPFLDVSAEIDALGERGLLGLAFDPNYAQNGFFYVNLINAAGDTEIRRYQVSANPDIANAASKQLVLTVDQPGASNHKAGWLGFGPDGMLYAALGDGGSSALTSQDLGNLLGKMLRLDVHPADPQQIYAIPSDNPFVGTPGARGEIFAFGLRNPWRDSFDRATGAFFIADVGQNAWEEVNIGAAGANYGWPNSEGLVGVGPGITAPIHTYEHPNGAGRSITGGYVYRGQSDFLQGQYFFADFIVSTTGTLRDTGGVWSATDRTGQIVPTPGTDVGSQASFGEDARGDLYVVDINGEVFRLTPNGVSGDGDDVISAGGGNDRVFAGAGNDGVSGEAGDDAINGMDGNDTLDGGIGNDHLDGGAGQDTAVFFSNRAAYTITRDGWHVTVNGPDGTDSLTAIEALRFADKTISLAVASDFNGDRRADILFRQDGASLASLYQWDMSGRSIIAQGAVDVFNKAFSQQAVGDYDGDGKSDVMLFNSATGEAYGWLLDGAAIKSQGQVEFVRDLPNSYRLLGSGDFNGDRHSDLLFRHSVGDLFLWQMDGIDAQQLYVGILPNAWRVVGAGDFGGDGNADMLLRNNDPSDAINYGAFYLWQMSGKQIIREGAIERPAIEWKTLGLGDFDGDGNTDFAVRNVSSGAENGAVWVYLMDGSTIRAQGGAGIADAAAWDLASINDYDGDGHDDIVFRNDAGYFYVWRMNGTSIASEGLLGAEAGAWADPALQVVRPNWDLA